MKYLFVAAFAAVAIGPVQAQEVAAGAPFETESAMPPAQLEAVVGKTDISMIVNSQNSNEVSNNVVSGNSVTGTISFSADSFQNLNGLSVLSANTGNNVAINSALNVNVAVLP